MKYELCTKVDGKKRFLYIREDGKPCLMSHNRTYFNQETAIVLQQKFAQYNFEIREIESKWIKDIKELMNDFSLHRECKQIIEELVNVSTEKELHDDRLMYEKAWKKFKNVLNTQRMYA